MTFQGSKNRYSQFICPILQKCIDENHIDIFYDPFVGGGNIIKNIKCANRFASDNNPYLIAFWQYIQEHPEYEFPPYPPRADWDKCKNKEEEREWYIGLVSIFCSNMAGGFPAGYDKKGLRYNGRIKNLRKDIPLIGDVEFKCADYRTVLENCENAVIYCDPPYANTHSYNYQKFDHDTFWDFMRQLSKNNYVFISEQTAPDDFISIWSKDISHNIRGNQRVATEQLFIYNT